MKKEFLDSLDMKKGEFVRTYASGQETRIPLAPGPNKFAVVEIEGETVETEVPNLTLQLLRQVLPKPKPKVQGKAKAKANAKGKGKAKAKAKPPPAPTLGGLYGDGDGDDEMWQLAAAEDNKNDDLESADDNEGQHEEDEEEEVEEEKEKTKATADADKKDKVGESAEPEEAQEDVQVPEEAPQDVQAPEEELPKGESKKKEDPTETVVVDRSYRKDWYKNGKQYGVRQRFGAKKQICSVGGKACVLSQKSKERITDELINELEKGMPEASAKKIVAEKVRAAEMKLKK